MGSPHWEPPIRKSVPQILDMLTATGYSSWSRERSNIKDADENRPAEAKELDRQRSSSGTLPVDVPRT